MGGPTPAPFYPPYTSGEIENSDNARLAFVSYLGDGFGPLPSPPVTGLHYVRVLTINSHTVTVIRVHVHTHLQVQLLLHGRQLSIWWFRHSDL